ncbi:MAG: translation initiation factor IF-2, partial [Nitrospirae bacterium]|nr:translation initiation factor IF-2 [Nitrospirota bacterium]
MGGKRVFELAKEFKISSKELIEELKKLGIEVSSHMAVVDEKAMGRLKGRFSKQGEKVSEVFKGVKSSAKTILIKKKPKIEIGEEIKPAIPVTPESAETMVPPGAILRAEEITGGKITGETQPGAEEKAEKIEKREDLVEVPVPLVTGQETVSAAGSPRVSKEVVKKAPPIVAEKKGAKEQKKKGIKVIITEPEEDLLISQRWKSFKAIPKKEKRARPGARFKLTKTDQSIEITKPRKKMIKLYEGTTVKEFADLIGQKSSEVIAKLIGMGMMVTINQPVDIDAALLVADSYGLKVEVAAEKKLEEYIEEPEDAPELLKPRAPVVTVMGHVDHGKTSLLDAIRKTKVTEGEAGGITQHIGAYVVDADGKRVVFLDTPGHEAFTAMRARGAKITDIVILVVAADDGVMPQTIEAINHAKAANVPIIVAINKIDKPGANPERIRQELTKYGLVPEEWGGENIFAEVSAKQRIGLDHLIEMILLQAEVLELKANPDKNTRGVILEAKLDKGRGPVATVLVQGGTLKQGAPFVCGTYWGRVRMLLSDTGKPIQEAPPATPVEVLGFSGVPQAGDIFAVADDEHIAKSIAASRLQKQR